MTPAQLTALKSEVQTDPKAKGYSTFLPASPGQVIALVNARTETMVKPRFVTARTVLAECGAGAGALLDKLDAAGASNPNVKWAMKFLTQDSGLDVGHVATQALLGSLAPATILQAEADQLKAMAVQPASHAEVALNLAGVVVMEADLRAAGVV
jgi:hypothetical protein